jgi:hypothetical protein
MGSSFYPVLERDIEGLEPELEVSGKALARNMDTLELICQQAGVRSLMDFYSESTDETAEHLAEELDESLAEALDGIPLVWFEPAEGLATVRALRSALLQRTDDWVEAMRDDLDALERVLVRAQTAGTRFRLRIDL